MKSISTSIICFALLNYTCGFSMTPTRDGNFLKSSTTSLSMAKSNKKKSSSKKKQASTKKGFGAAPPSLDEVVAGIRNKIPVDADTQPCPCGIGGKTYENCCKKFHSGEETPSSPLNVLQSRYTAFAFRLPKYIVDTTHPVCADYKKDKITAVKELHKEGMFDSFTFVKLEAGEEEPGKDEDEAFIEFKVHMKANDSFGQYVQDEDVVICERSQFLKEDGIFKYASGVVKSEASGLEDVILNP